MLCDALGGRWCEIETAIVGYKIIFWRYGDNMMDEEL